MDKLNYLIFSLILALVAVRGSARAAANDDSCLATFETGPEGFYFSYYVKCGADRPFQVRDRNSDHLVSKLNQTMQERGYFISNGYFNGRLYLYEENQETQSRPSKRCLIIVESLSNDMGIFGGMHMEYHADCGEAYTYQLKDPSERGVINFAQETGAVSIQKIESFRSTPRPQETYYILTK